jgi:GAF domain-containing protein
VSGPRDALEALLSFLSLGDLDALLEKDADAAARAARAAGPLEQLLELRAWEESCRQRLPGGPSADEWAAALHELGRRRLEAIMLAHDREMARRLEEAEDHGATALARARELQAANRALQAANAQSQHRADQIALVSSFAHRIARVTDAERLLQEAAEVIQARMNHTYVAVVILDDEGVLVGRWAGRPGVGRRHSGRTQGPAGGVIGRALRKRAPQVVDDVAVDPDYHADVAGTRSEMVIPLLEEGEARGALDFQSERPSAFDLDAVATGETVAEFLVIALRNARLLGEARRP